MNENSSIIHFRQPDEIDDPLTALLRSGARRLLEQAIEAEVEAFLASRKELKLADGRDRLVRHGHGPERVIQTGVGPVELQRVKVRDRAAGPASERIRFTSALLPRWARRTTSLDALLPILYLRGVSAGDFQEALGVQALSPLSPTSRIRGFLKGALEPDQGISGKGLHYSGVSGERGSGDSRRRLGRQMELEPLDQELQFRLGLRAAGQDEFAAIRGRHMDVDHLNSRELFQGASRREPRRQGIKATM